ncbi:MAG: Dabb family protein [Muribaculaceae bacterium]|nr:Dabb family protein [Muribaculaceae bacterium]
MIVHNVMFRLEGERAHELAVDFKAAIERLPSVIAELDSVSVRLDDGAIAGNWTLILVARCADEAALAAYSAHPAHLDCVAIIKPAIAARACVDYTE